MLVSRTAAGHASATLNREELNAPDSGSSGAFTDHYRCPREFAAFGLTGELSSGDRFFRFRNALGYGRCRDTRDTNESDLWDEVECGQEQVKLPFDLSEAVTNLQRERYCQFSHGGGLWQDVYYALRPYLSVPVRKHLQRLRLTGWERIPFPRWPVDVTVETLLAGAMALQLKAGVRAKIPFIWFWPDGAPGCAIMTHDVESLEGRDFCEQLMDLDDESGIKSAFNVIPELRYEVPVAFLERFRTRGFELNVHDLNHDGRLFRSKKQFLERVARINEYGRSFGSRGFRTGTMYRQQDWFDALEFAYDMSVPNAAHLEPQRGGCCTVMPYFNGDLLELPLTTAQDYSLFHILNDYSISLWKLQSELILEKHGLLSFITHPDYLTAPRARKVYLKLLAYLRELRDERGVWFALPGDVERWWRNRGRMSLVRAGDHWKIEGPDAHRARVAFASLDDDEVVYSFS
jgi:hypothetical protein